MADSIICQRSFEFAARILNLCAKLWDQGPKARRIASELIRCGTAIGANAEEAQDGQTKPDYIAKNECLQKGVQGNSVLVETGIARQCRDV